MTPNRDRRWRDEDIVVDERDAALRRLTLRRSFWRSFAAFVVFNGAMVLVWALSGGGYFWPGWLIAIWGAGLVLHGWRAFFVQPLTEADVDKEIRRHGLGS